MLSRDVALGERPLKVNPIHLEPGKVWCVDEAVVQMPIIFHATLSHL